jgi:trigger factor
VEREARLGDLVTLDVEGTVEGNTVLDNKDTEYQLSPNSAMPVPGFAEQISGMKVGEEIEFTLPFPDDHPNAELSGKECCFKASISEVKEEHLPELDDAFVKSLGQDLETIEQIRERLADNLQAAAEREARNKLENQVIDAVVDLATVEFPAVLVEQEIDRMGREQLMRLGGMNLETYLGYRGMTEEDFRSELRPLAERRVKSSLVLNEVYGAENIEINDAEVDAEVERMVQNAGERSEQIQQMFSSPEARDSVRSELLTRKTIDRLIEIATSEDIEVGEDEVQGETA